MDITLHGFRLRVAQTRFRVPLIWLKHHHLDPQIWWRHRGIDSSDGFIASYPRSGTRWTMFQLIEILTGQPADFDTMHDLIPLLGSHQKAPPLLPGGGRLIQTHEWYRPEYKRVIYLVRDVRDVVLSHYQWDKRINLYYTDSFHRYLRAFLEGKIYGFAPWHAHVSSWLDSPLAKRGDLLVVRYEDMRADTEGTLALVVKFLGVNTDAEVIQRAILNNSLERMRVKEDGSTRFWRPKQEEGRSAGKGFVGGWREKLTESQVQLIGRFAGSALARLGYPTGRDALNKENQQLTSLAETVE
jgi:hypothetical protein